MAGNSREPLKSGFFRERFPEAVVVPFLADVHVVTIDWRADKITGGGVHHVDTNAWIDLGEIDDIRRPYGHNVLLRQGKAERGCKHQQTDYRDRTHSIICTPGGGTLQSRAILSERYK